MHDRLSLYDRLNSQSRMDNQEPQGRQTPEITLLNRLSQGIQTPSLLSRMENQHSLQGLPLRQAQGSITTFSSTVMPLSKDIVRGRSLKRRRISKSNLSLPKSSEMIEREPMQLLDHSSRPLRAMTPRMRQQLEEEEFSNRKSAPPALLYRFQMEDGQMSSQSPSESRSTSQRMHGSKTDKTNVRCYETPLRRHSNSLRSTQSTLNQQSDPSSMSQTVPSSPTLSGKISYLEGPSISTQSSVDNSLPQTTTPKSRNSEISRSPLAPLSPLSWSRTEGTGLSPGTGLSEPPSSHSLIEPRNLRAMENLLSICSQSLTPVSMVGSLRSTKRSGREWEASGTSNYLILRNSPISRLRTWIRSGYRSSQDPQKKMEVERGSGARTGKGMSHAIDGTMESVTKKRTIAEGCTSATDVRKEDIRAKTAGSNEIEPIRPKYMQRSVWTDADASHLFSPTACSTLTDDPLPRPPPEEFMNLDAVSTVKNNPHLFKIITPINVARFEELLESHPNQLFVRSICTSFREGFWPWAITQREEYPGTWDFSERPPKTESEAGFLREQRDIEISAQRYSENFGTHLLPGMYSTPIHAVPKPRSEKLRLVNDHSAGPFSLNSMISREDVAGAKMDSISDLVGALLRYRRDHPDRTLILFKSDVSATYRRLPLHPLWQITQIVTMDEARHIDRCTSFGARGSCRDYTAFMGLVLWLAIFIKFLTDLFGYIDDNFLFDEEGNVLWYEPYKCYYPAKQAKLLMFWDEISLPHDKAKQEYGPVLCIIGFMVDPNLMRVSMDEEDRNRLLQHVTDFTATAPGGTRRTLREFQQLAGWINWSFNVLPLLKPALSIVYAKIGGKHQSHA